MIEDENVDDHLEVLCLLVGISDFDFYLIWARRHLFLDPYIIQYGLVLQKTSTGQHTWVGVFELDSRKGWFGDPKIQTVEIIWHMRILGRFLNLLFTLQNATSAFRAWFKWRTGQDQLVPWLGRCNYSKTLNISENCMDRWIMLVLGDTVSRPPHLSYIEPLY